MVKRYNINQFSGWEPNCDIDEDVSGDYVTYADYARLEAERDELVDAASNAIEDSGVYEWSPVHKVYPPELSSLMRVLGKIKVESNE